MSGFKVSITVTGDATDEAVALELELMAVKIRRKAVRWTQTIYGSGAPSMQASNWHNRVWINPAPIANSLEGPWEKREPYTVPLRENAP